MKCLLLIKNKAAVSCEVVSYFRVPTVFNYFVLLVADFLWLAWYLYPVEFFLKSKNVDFHSSDFIHSTLTLLKQVSVAQSFGLLTSTVLGTMNKQNGVLSTWENVLCVGA